VFAQRHSPSFTHVTKKKKLGQYFFTARAKHFATQKMDLVSPRPMFPLTPGGQGRGRPHNSCLAAAVAVAVAPVAITTSGVFLVRILVLVGASSDLGAALARFSASLAVVGAWGDHPPSGGGGLGEARGPHGGATGGAALTFPPGR
jgi:hypothetical protein